MQNSQEQGGEAGAGKQDGSTDGELSDDILDELNGGISDAAVRMEAGGNAAQTVVQPMPVNDYLGTVRSIPYV